MKTRKLFQQNVYLKSVTATVSSVNYDSDNTIVTLDQTVFFPEGGGQSGDCGTLTKNGTVFPVIDTQEGDTGEILHIISGRTENLCPGDTVETVLDWPHRFDNMQRHCGEHILSGAVYRLFGGANKGFHMGEDSITIDISFNGDSSSGAYEKMTWEMAEAAETEANRVIWQDLPVSVDRFDTREEAEKFPLRKTLAFDEDISIVTIGSRDNPADCVACCGTHPARSGAVGLIKIYKIEPNKGMSRIYFEAGQRALTHYQNQFNTLYELGNRMSAGYDDLLRKYDAQTAKNQQLHDRLSAFRARILNAEQQRLDAEMHPGLISRYDDLTVDDLFNLGKKIGPVCQGVIALVHEPSHTAILLSNEKHCGRLVKAIAPQFSGKGGGNDSSARAFFPDKEHLEAFLSAALA